MSVTDANGNTTNTLYDKLGRVIKVQTPFDDTVSGETKTYYDKNSNVIKTAVRKEGNEYQTEEYKYDNMGNRIAAISGDDDETTVVQYEYDTANRMTKMITGLTAYSENPTGGAITTYQYGTNGFLSKVTDPMGKSEEYPQYDYYGNVTEKIDRNGNVFDYTYGAYGVKIDNSWGGAKKENVYNSLGQIIKTINNNENGKTVEESCAYDPFGRMTSMTSSDGTVQNYTYDSNSGAVSSFV